jgi:hypothetical protein
MSRGFFLLIVYRLRETRRKLTAFCSSLQHGFWVKLKVTVKVKLSVSLTKHHAMKTFLGSGGIAPCILRPQH